MRRTLWLLSTMVLALLLAGGLALVALSPAARADVDCQPSGSEVVCTITYTGAAQSWTVPEGVTQATFDVYGAQGGSEPGFRVGGGGGRAQATINVTPGDTLQVNVGGAGGGGGVFVIGAGGFNGGAAGGTASSGGGGGGGASDIRTGDFELADRIIVAGGGGGVGVRNGGAGGAGGDIVGGNGDPARGQVSDGQGGLGGTASSGGEGGAAGPPVQGGGTFSAGADGDLGVGGAGGSFDRTTCCGGGGGGGGGYYGGGGGGSGLQGGGGGGGSGFVDPQASDVQFQSGVRGGNGLVTITYTDTTAPSVTIDQAQGQADPTSTSPIHFTAVFSEPVTGFTGSDVTLSGSAGATAAVVSGGPTTFDIAVSGMTSDGTVIASIPANAAQDVAQNGNNASTSTDNTVTFTVTAANEAPTVTVDGGGSCGSASDMRGTINLSLSDPDDPPQSLTLSATSSNRSVLPNRNISFGGGTDASRTMTVTSLTGSGTSNVTIRVSDGDLQATVVVRVISGSASNNTLTGSAASDMIFARKGNDTVSAQGANDLMCGGNGNDRLTGGDGGDRFGGGSGTDTATDFEAGEGDIKGGIEIF